MGTKTYNPIIIINDRELRFISLCLLFSTFNDWLRIPSTPISLYRLLFPIALFLCLQQLSKRKNYILCFVLFSIINLIQNYIFFNISGISTDSRLTFKYFLLYLSIFSIFLMVKFIRTKSIPAFKQLIFSFLPAIGLINLAFYWLCETPAKAMLNLANRNNYAVSLAAIFPYFFLKGFENKKKYFIPCFAILFSLYIVGSKAALFGIGLEVALILAMKVMQKMRYANSAGILFLVSAYLVMVMIVQSPITINGHPINRYFSELTSRVISGELYPDCRESVRWRTNAIIYMLSLTRETNGMGIGIGNTGVYLAAFMPEVDRYLQNQPDEIGRKVLSPHFALLEFISDCGLWAIVLLLIILKSALEKFMNAKHNDFMDFYFTSFTLSFPIWCMSASGVYTIYYLFIVMACLYEWYQIPAERKDSIDENHDFCDRA